MHHHYKGAKAIQRHHPGQTMEELVYHHIDSLKLQLPKDEQERITREIRREDQERAAEAEVNRRFSAFRVTENGATVCFEVEQAVDIPLAATRLRGFLKSGTAASEWYSDRAFHNGKLISESRFEQHTAALLRGDARLTGVYDIDLDSGRFSSLDPRGGWRSYKVKDISAAAYYAMKESHTGWGQRTCRFLKRIEGKQIFDGHYPVLIRGEEPLPVDKIFPEQEISEIGNGLNFYIPVVFNPDLVFGTYVNTDQNDDWINVYANYDLERGCICDTLDICLVRGDGSELDCEYRITPEEQAALTAKMDDYCRKQWGTTLSDARSRYLEESAEGVQMSGMK